VLLIGSGALLSVGSRRRFVYVVISQNTAPTVMRLQQAGCIILATTNVSEYALSPWR